MEERGQQRGVPASSPLTPSTLHPNPLAVAHPAAIAPSAPTPTRTRPGCRRRAPRDDTALFKGSESLNVGVGLVSSRGQSR